MANYYDEEKQIEVTYIWGDPTGAFLLGCRLAQEAYSKRGLDVFKTCSNEGNFMKGYNGEECIFLTGLIGKDMSVREFAKFINGKTESRFENVNLGNVRVIIITAREMPIDLKFRDEADRWNMLFCYSDINHLYEVCSDDTLRRKVLEYPDAEVRMVAFTESLHEAIVTDDEPWHKKGFDMMHALQTGNIEYFLAMACGWGAKSLAKRAMIIPDSENMYHSEDESGTLVVYWEDGVETSSNCKVDAATFHVWGWAEDAFKHPSNPNVQIARIGIRVAPIEVDNLYEFCCVSKKERDMSGYDSLYWYDSMFNSIP